MWHKSARRQSVGREWTRREILRGAAPGVVLAGGLALTTRGHAAPVWDRALGKEVEQAVRAALGGRRGGVALAGIEADSPLLAVQPAGIPYRPESRQAATGGDRILAANQTLWRPGSTLKPFLLEALANKKVCGFSSEYRCPGELRIRDRVLDCSHPRHPGPLVAAEALAYSCNAYFAHFARRLPVDAFSEVLRQAGLASRQAFGVACAPAEVGSVSHPEDHLLQCLGEALVLTTPLALLAAYQRLLQRMEAQPNAVATVMLREGMRGCVEGGTGSEARVPGLAIAGKTGTGGARGRTHLNGWFVSCAPAEAPRVVMVTFVEHGSGGADAAPLARVVWSLLKERRVVG